MRGIDISNWQQGIIPPAMQIDFCICKATEGIGYTDPSYNRFIADCMEGYLPFGFYHFARENSPEQEARWFYSQVMDEIGYGLPVLDYEVSNYDNVDWCERFITEFHELSGTWCVLYISASRCGEYEDSWIPDKCKLWIAGYPYAATDWTESACPYNCYPWKRSNLIIWQFTSSLILDGYPGRLDGNIAYIGKASWDAISKGDDIEMVTDNDIERIAQKVWEYRYRAGTDEQDEILKKNGISKNGDSNRYNVLNACVALIARICDKLGIDKEI